MLKIKKSIAELQVFVFIKAQASAFIGGIVDYLTMIICKELLGLDIRIAVAIGGVIGAVVNFSINRKWTYKAASGKLNLQLIKFIVVVAGSIFLKAYGTYLLAEWLRIDYKIVRIIVDIIVSLGFNYTLQTYWVFREKTNMGIPDTNPLENVQRGVLDAEEES